MSRTHCSRHGGQNPSVGTPLEEHPCGLGRLPGPVGPTVLRAGAGTFAALQHAATHVEHLQVSPVAMLPAHDPPLGTSALLGQVGMRQYLQREQGGRMQESRRGTAL